MAKKETDNVKHGKRRRLIEDMPDGGGGKLLKAVSQFDKKTTKGTSRGKGIKVGTMTTDQLNRRDERLARQSSGVKSDGREVYSHKDSRNIPTGSQSKGGKGYKVGE